MKKLLLKNPMINCNYSCNLIDVRPQTTDEFKILIPTIVQYFKL